MARCHTESYPIIRAESACTRIDGVASEQYILEIELEHGIVYSAVATLQVKRSRYEVERNVSLWLQWNVITSGNFRLLLLLYVFH